MHNAQRYPADEELVGDWGEWRKNAGVGQTEETQGMGLKDRISQWQGVTKGGGEGMGSRGR